MFTGGKGDNSKGGSKEQQTAVKIKKIKYSVLDLKWQRKAKRYYKLSSGSAHHTYLFSFSSMYSWSDTSGSWTTLTRTGLELCRSLLTSWTRRSWLQISPVTWRPPSLFNKSRRRVVITNQTVLIDIVTSWMISDMPSSSSSASVVAGGSRDRPEPTHWKPVGEDRKKRQHLVKM